MLTLFKKHAAQITLFFIILMGVLMLFMIVIMDISQMSTKKLTMDMVVDNAAMTLGSIMVSKAKAIADNQLEGDVIGGATGPFGISGWMSYIVAGVIIVVCLIVSIASYGTMAAEAYLLLILALGAISGFGGWLAAQSSEKMNAIKGWANTLLLLTSEDSQTRESVMLGVLPALVNDPVKVTDIKDFNHNTRRDDKINRFMYFYSERVAKLINYENASIGTEYKTAMKAVGDAFNSDFTNSADAAKNLDTWLADRRTFLKGTLWPLMKALNDPLDKGSGRTNKDALAAAIQTVDDNSWYTFQHSSLKNLPSKKYIPDQFTINGKEYWDKSEDPVSSDNLTPLGATSDARTTTMISLDEFLKDVLVSSNPADALEDYASNPAASTVANISILSKLMYKLYNSQAAAGFDTELALVPMVLNDISLTRDSSDDSFFPYDTTDDTEVTLAFTERARWMPGLISTTNTQFRGKIRPDQFFMQSGLGETFRTWADWYVELEPVLQEKMYTLGDYAEGDTKKIYDQDDSEVTADGELYSLKQELTNLGSKIGDVDTRISGLDSAAENYQASLDGLTNQRAALVNLQTQLNTAKTNLEDISAKVKNITEYPDDLSSAFETVTTANGFTFPVARAEWISGKPYRSEIPLTSEFLDSWVNQTLSNVGTVSAFTERVYPDVGRAMYVWRDPKGEKLWHIVYADTDPIIMPRVGGSFDANHANNGCQEESYGYIEPYARKSIATGADWYKDATYKLERRTFSAWIRAGRFDEPEKVLGWQMFTKLNKTGGPAAWSAIKARLESVVPTMSSNPFGEEAGMLNYSYVTGIDTGTDTSVLFNDICDFLYEYGVWSAARSDTGWGYADGPPKPIQLPWESTGPASKDYKSRWKVDIGATQ